MIEVYTLDNEAWDRVVKSFSEYDVYYLSGYVKAFEKNGDGIAQLIYIYNDTTKAMNVVFKRDISDDKRLAMEISQGQYYDFTTPYGYGGFLIEGEDIKSLMEEYKSYCKKSGIVCEFVRFHPLLSNWEKLEEEFEVLPLGNTVYVDTSEKDIIWDNITSKNRNMIRKARKSGLHVYWGRNPSIIKPFKQIYNQTMIKDNASDYYFFGDDFYESILEDLKYNSMWFYAEKDGEIAAISIFMFCNGRMHYHLSASQSKFQMLAPTNLLLYEAALWACENGYKELHLGGGVGAGQDSLYKFKKAFNRKEDKKFCIGRNIYDNEMYEKLIAIRKKTDNNFDADNSYFPLYRS